MDHGLKLALCPGARFKAKDWGVANYVALLGALAAAPPFRGMTVHVLGGTEDRATAAVIEQGAREAGGMTVRDWTGRCDVHQAMALIERCDLCVGNDTFGLHAAIAVGTPSVVLLWGGDGDRWSPWGDPAKHRMVRAAVDCGGCGGVCAQPGHDCMARIDVAAVADCARGLVSRT